MKMAQRPVWVEGADLPSTGTMASKCLKCDKTVYLEEKVSSLGKDWHKFCLKCEHCNKTLTPRGHAEHDGKYFCHKPCYATVWTQRSEYRGRWFLHL